jgi:hypothetical protein
LDEFEEEKNVEIVPAEDFLECLENYLGIKYLS